MNQENIERIADKIIDILVDEKVKVGEVSKILYEAEKIAREPMREAWEQSTSKIVSR